MKTSEPQSRTPSRILIRPIPSTANLSQLHHPLPSPELDDLAFLSLVVRHLLCLARRELHDVVVELALAGELLPSPCCSLVTWSEGLTQLNQSITDMKRLVDQ